MEKFGAQPPRFSKLPRAPRQSARKKIASRHSSFSPLSLLRTLRNRSAPSPLQKRQPFVAAPTPGLSRAWQLGAAGGVQRGRPRPAGCRRAKGAVFPALFCEAAAAPCVRQPLCAGRHRGIIDGHTLSRRQPPASALCRPAARRQTALPHPSLKIHHLCLFTTPSPPAAGRRLAREG